MQPLSKLLHSAGIAAQIIGNSDAQIASITTDSRSVKQGALYVAIRGVTVDGNQFIADAISRGAVAVVTDSVEAAISAANIAFVQCADARIALANLAAAFYPAQPKYLSAVTGTDGKTSVAEFTRQLAVLCGHTSASIGTLGLTVDDQALREQFTVNHTSPDPILLHRMLSVLDTAGVDMVAMEASSHGLHQHRLDGVRFKAAAFTNLTRDHLDYHVTVEAYGQAKLRLFSEVIPTDACAVINADDAFSAQIASVCASRGIRMLRYGMRAEELKIESIAADAKGLSASLIIEGTQIILRCNMYGAFQIYNMLAAVGLVHGMTGKPLPEIVALCAQLTNVRGRMERVANHPSGAPIFIDYAHTPAALEKVLQVTRAHVRGNISLVFGCGGDRDTGKRPLMGEVAERLADSVIVTDDNPRSEDAAAIRAAILARCPKAKECGDRAEAIARALKNLTKDDALIVAGKGHETTQIIGTHAHEFNDASAVREALVCL
jgi:UDP-N-acetylmuramyl-tripeptide synthetase